MATHSSIPAWEIPRTEEPGGLQPKGSQRVGHDSAAKPSPKIKCTDLYGKPVTLTHSSTWKWLGWDYRRLRERPQRYSAIFITSYQGRTLSARLMADDASLGHWLRLHTALFGRKSLSAPPVKKSKVKFLSLRIQLLKLFGITQLRWFICLLTFVNLFDLVLYPYGLMDIHFPLWVIIQCCFIVFLSNCPSFDHWELFQLAPVSLWKTSIIICMCFCGFKKYVHFTYTWLLKLQ